MTVSRLAAAFGRCLIGLRTVSRLAESNGRLAVGREEEMLEPSHN